MRQLTSLVVLLLISRVVCAADLRAGVASVVINPAMGTPMAGYYSPRAAAGVHDDLHAKAIVLEKDGAKAAMVSCDLLTLPRSIVVEARRIIESTTKIPADHVMISATHTHTGPTLPMGSARDPSEGGEAQKVDQYAATLPELIARAVKEADAALAPVSVFIGHGREEHLSFNPTAGIS
jgi:hypothetical protein